MTTTPHPADALPLPEPDEVACVGGVAQNIWCEPKIRAARREGFELAMSKSKAEIASLRFMLAVRVAGSALYGDDGELQDNSTYPQIDFKRDSVEEIESKLIERGTRRFVQDMNALASQPAQQQAGAAEVSDEQIDEVLLFETGFDGFGTQEMNSDDLRRVCRAVLALKTAGGVA